MTVPTFDDIPKDINALIAAHIKQYLTDPKAAHIWDATPVGLGGPVTTLLITTTGRKSGVPRNVPLLYVDNDGTFLVMGSKGGNVDHPFWYMNLLDEPECEIRVGEFHTRATSRTLSGDERAKAWQKIVAKHHVYGKYQARAEREIPVVELIPIGKPLS
jgi:deazaflavin-dependent oxidoreductase (nitroreductase family)